MPTEDKKKRPTGTTKNTEKRESKNTMSRKSQDAEKSNSLAEKKDVRGVTPQAARKKGIKSGKPKEVKKTTYSVQGELEIVTSPVPPITSEVRSFTTPAVTMDSLGQLFTNASLEISLDGKRQIVVMTSRQVKMMLNAMGIVPYGEVE